MRALLALLVACVAASTSVRAAGTPPTVDEFFRHPAVSDARMSPSGRLLGVLLAGSSGRMVVGFDLTTQRSFGLRLAPTLGESQEKALFASQPIDHNIGFAFQ